MTTAAPVPLQPAVPATHVEPWTACDPEAAATRLRGRPGLAWLDSSLPHDEIGRWSIVASDPRWTLTATAGGVRFDDGRGPRWIEGGALAALARLVEAEPHAEAPGLPFAGGAIGTLGFELAREVEQLPATTLDDTGAPLLSFGWYDAALVWNEVARRGWLVGRADAVRALRARLEAPVEPLPPFVGSCAAAPGALRSNMTVAAYEAAVERARAYIEAGDIYQVNFAQRFSLPLRADGFQVYRRLRVASPAPFAAYLDSRASGGVEVLSSSPERFLLVDGDHLETRPIKGTRPRGADEREDAALAEALCASRKDLAEHVMIVDLERNDLGRVAVPGSVRVPRFAALESYRHVHHLVSSVEARRRPGVGLEALLRATFPGGSISGAPKVRALEIIDELEPHTRGVYCGAIGYLSADGRIDLNIAIRTITLVDGVAHFHVGGAIVHDSRPAAEYAETLDKARGMARALGVALPDEPPEDDA